MLTLNDWLTVCMFVEQMSVNEIKCLKENYINPHYYEKKNQNGLFTLINVIITKWEKMEERATKISTN